MIGAIKPWEGTGYALLLSADNKVVSSPDKAATGKPRSGTIGAEAVVRTDDALLKEPAFVTGAPSTLVTVRRHGSWRL